MARSPCCDARIDRGECLECLQPVETEEDAQERAEQVLEEVEAEDAQVYAYRDDYGDAKDLARDLRDGPDEQSLNASHEDLVAFIENKLEE